MARDYVLVLFNKNLKVQSSDLNVKGELANYVKNFLKIFGLERCDLNKTISQSMPYWKFRELPDESFKKNFPNDVKEQELLFESLERHVYGVIGNVGKRKLSKSAVANSGVNSDLVQPANPDPRVTSLSGVPPGRMTMSNETRHALPIALKKLFQTHKVCRYGCRDIYLLVISHVEMVP